MKLLEKHLKKRIENFCYQLRQAIDKHCIITNTSEVIARSCLKKYIEELNIADFIDKTNRITIVDDEKSIVPIILQGEVIGFVIVLHDDNKCTDSDLQLVILIAKLLASEFDV